MIEILTYKVRKRHWWSRGWQAEFEGIAMCPRGWTEKAARRKAVRLAAMNLERRLIRSNRRRLIRAHITRRSDPYNVELRKLGWWTYNPDYRPGANQRQGSDAQEGAMTNQGNDA